MSRRKRRNSDDSIRAAERVAFATYEPADIAAYWTACLRSGTMPKPNLACIKSRKYNEWLKVTKLEEDDIHLNESEGWWLGFISNSSIPTFMSGPRVVVPKNDNRYYLFDIPPFVQASLVGDWTPTAALSCIRKLLTHAP